ncbi:MAG TPA: copper transporter [Streptosporangiaceae bacterium]|nr:copper transporter [Streptosporangiaceae bacterium]
MIDFRYHLVSIIAVFLALAVGLAIGANTLSTATTRVLQNEANRVTGENNRLTKENATLKQQISADQNFAQAAGGPLLSHLLTGQSVVLVTAPGADSQTVSGVTAAVKQAGGAVTGQVSLQSQFFNSTERTEQNLLQVAQAQAPDAGVALPTQPVAGPTGGQQEAAEVIAADVVAKNGVGLTSEQSQAVLSGFGQQGYLTINTPGNSSPSTLSPATMAVVVAPATPPSSNDSSPANLALIAVAEQFQAASHRTVLVGSLTGSGPGSVINAVVSGAGKVSTVDNADQPSGEITTVQALVELMAGRAPANYGVGPGVVPSPAPTPSPSPTSTSTPTTTTKHSGKKSPDHKTDPHHARKTT